MACTSLAGDIQEYLEGNREIRSLNQVKSFLDRLGHDVDDYEQAKLSTELTVGAAVCSTQALLRLGVASTVLVGAMLMAAGSCDLMVFFCFMLVVTRLYDPISLVLQSIAELIDMRLSLDRMRTVMNADKIIVLDKGRVAEQGAPQELLDADGLFARMVRLQNESADWSLGASRKSLAEVS